MVVFVSALFLTRNALNAMNSKGFGDFHDFRCLTGLAGRPASAGLSQALILAINPGQAGQGLFFVRTKEKGFICRAQRPRIPRAQGGPHRDRPLIPP